MSKKLAAEIERCLREAQMNMQVYDTKWRELKSYNEATANPDWATLGSGVIKASAPEPLLLSGLRPKKLTPTASFITVDISNMSEKQVTEVREKLKNELEQLMKKVYRSRQQLIDWLGHADLRQTGFTKEHLLDAKKEIESRHRRGKIYYLKGVSSEDTSNEQASQFNDVVNWMSEYIEILKEKSDQFTAEMENMTKSPDYDDDRLEELANAVDMYIAHANKLDEFLRGIRNNSISVTEDAETSPSPNTDINQEDDEGSPKEDSLNVLLDRLAELRDLLSPLIDGNEGLTYMVTEDIYSDLGITVSSVSQVELPSRPIQKEETNEVISPPKAVPTPPAAAPVSTPAPIKTTPPVRLPSGGVSTPEETNPAVAKAVSYRAVIKKSPDLLLQSRVEKLKSQLNRPTWWSERAVSLAEGVTSDVCDTGLLAKLTPAAREQVLHQVEFSLGNSQGDLLPVLVVDDAVKACRVREPWHGHIPGGSLPSDQSTSLLFLDEGNIVEVLAEANQDRWTYGRLQNDKSRQGWFPSHIVMALSR